MNPAEIAAIIVAALVNELPAIEAALVGGDRQKAQDILEETAMRVAFDEYERRKRGEAP